MSLLPLQLRPLEMDERPETAVVERFERLLERASLRAPLVERQVAHGAEEPRPQGQLAAALLVVLARQGLVRAHEGVLDDFLGVEGVLQDAVRVGEERPLEALDEPLECAGITAVDRHGQPAVVHRLGEGLAAGPRVLHR